MSDPVALNNRARVLASVAYLLDYPDERWRSGLDEVLRELDGIANRDAYDAIASFCSWARAQEPSELEGSYVSSFDFGKKTSLHLTSRGRDDVSQQRADMLAYSMYFAESGYEVAGESADYLPALLELAVAAGDEEADLVLTGARSDLAKLLSELAAADLGAYASLVQLVFDMVPAPVKEATSR